MNKAKTLIHNGSEWKLVKVSEILKRIVNPVIVEQDTFYEQIGIRSHGKGIFYKEPISGKEIGKKRIFWIEKDLFIVNIVFAWERAVARTTEKEIGFVASHRFPMYKPVKLKADLDYLLFFFLTKKGNNLLEMASPGGAGRNKTLGQKEFEKLTFYIPNISEQQKIADYLSTIDEKLSLLEEKKTELSRYKKAMMRKLFSQEIRFKDENGNEYPEWEEKRLGEVFNSYNGLTGKTKENFGFGKPYIKYTQVFNDSKINIQNFDFVEITENDKQNSVEFGDAFFTVSSETPHEVGMSSVLLDSVEDVYLNSFCFGIRLISKNLNPYYYRYFFRSKKFRKEVIKLAQGSTRYNMSKIEFMKINIQIPSLPEQQKIADFLSVIDESIDKVSEQIKETQSFKKAMLQQMFV